jgi:hypothetical protein
LIWIHDAAKNSVCQNLRQADKVLTFDKKAVS